MFASTMHGDAQQPILTFSGSLTVEHCREIHQALLEHLTDVSTLTLDLRNTDRADLSFVQLLVALLKNQSIALAPLPDHLTALLTAVGAGNLLPAIADAIPPNV